MLRMRDRAIRSFNSKFSAMHVMTCHDRGYIVVISLLGRSAKALLEALLWARDWATERRSTACDQVHKDLFLTAVRFSWLDYLDCTEVIHGDTVCNDLCSIGLQVPYICIVELLNVLISESAETCWDHGLRPRLKRGRGCCSSFWHWCHAAVPSSADIQEHHQWLVLFGIPLLDYCNIL